MVKLTRGIRNCNPFNIKFNKRNRWLGQLSQTDGPFAKFSNLDYGCRAGVILLRNYIEKFGLDNVPNIILRFAPSSENDAYSYIRFVSDTMDIAGYKTTDIRFGTKRFCMLCKSIVYYESKYLVPLEYFEDIISKFHIKSTKVYEQEIF